MNVPSQTPKPLALAVPEGFITRATAIDLIRSALRQRSGKTWSVTGGRGTGYGWLRIESPPKRRVCYHVGIGNECATPERCATYTSGYMSIEDCAELGALMGREHVHFQGLSVPSDSDAYRLYIALAQTGESHGFTFERSWD
jgi:hypothetical protein